MLINLNMEYGYEYELQHRNRNNILKNIFIQALIISNTIISTTLFIDIDAIRLPITRVTMLLGLVLFIIIGNYILISNVEKVIYAMFFISNIILLLLVPIMVMFYNMVW